MSDWLEGALDCDAMVRNCDCALEKLQTNIKQTVLLGKMKEIQDNHRQFTAHIISKHVNLVAFINIFGRAQIRYYNQQIWEGPAKTRRFTSRQPLGSVTGCN